MIRLSTLALILIMLSSCSNSSSHKSTTAEDEKTNKQKKNDVEKSQIAPEQPKASVVQKTQLETVANNRKKVICKFVQEERILEIVPLENDQGCQLIYTKYNESSEKARANSDISVCHSVLNKIKANIETYGFDCTTVK